MNNEDTFMGATGWVNVNIRRWRIGLEDASGTCRLQF